MNFVIVPSLSPLLPRSNDAITLATEKQLLAQLQFHLKIAFCTKMFAVLGKMFLTSFMFVRGRENMKTNGAWAFSFGKVHEIFFLLYRCIENVLQFVFWRLYFGDPKRFQRSLFVLIVYCPIPQRVKSIGSGWAYIHTYVSLTCLTTNHGKTLQSCCKALGAYETNNKSKTNSQLSGLRRRKQQGNISTYFL